MIQTSKLIITIAGQRWNFFNETNFASTNIPQPFQTLTSIKELITRTRKYRVKGQQNYHQMQNSLHSHLTVLFLLKIWNTGINRTMTGGLKLTKRHFLLAS